MTEIKKTMYFILLQRCEFRFYLIGPIKGPHAGLKCVMVLKKCAVISSRRAMNDAMYSTSLTAKGCLAQHTPYYP
jgi:hypothetical protein